MPSPNLRGEGFSEKSSKGVDMRRTIGLVTFLKGNTDPAVGIPGCANYDHHHGGCLVGEACKVEQGKRCGYFERAVLPTANDVGLGERVYSLYEKQTGIKVYWFSVNRTNPLHS